MRLPDGGVLATRATPELTYAVSMTALGVFANLFYDALLGVEGGIWQGVVFRGRLAFSHGYVGGGVGRTGVVGARTDEAVVVVLLDDVRGPTGDAADGEDGGEEVDVDA
jgi:hypothetical protein